MRCFVVLIALGVTVSSIGYSQVTERKTLTICDLFEDLKSFSGRIVEIRGEIMTGPNTFALGLRGCSGTFQTDGIKWPTAVDLVEAGSSRLEFPTALILDRQAVARMDQLLCFLGSHTAAELGVEISATFVGEVRMRGVYRARRSPNGIPYGGGYGHMGAFPAQLVYSTVRDIVIRQVTPDYPKQ